MKKPRAEGLLRDLSDALMPSFLLVAHLRGVVALKLAFDGGDAVRNLLLVLLARPTPWFVLELMEFPPKPAFLARRESYAFHEAPLMHAVASVLPRQEYTYYL